MINQTEMRTVEMAISGVLTHRTEAAQRSRSIVYEGGSKGRNSLGSFQCILKRFFLSESYRISSNIISKAYKVP